MFLALAISAVLFLGSCSSYESSEPPSEAVWGTWEADYRPSGWTDEQYIFERETMSLTIIYDDRSTKVFEIDEVTNTMIVSGEMKMKYRLFRENDRLKVSWYNSGNDTWDEGWYITFDRK